MRGFLLTINALTGLLSSAIASPPTRDCYTGSSPLCNNSLASDTACRGLQVTTADGWKQMNCDYVIYNIPTTTRITEKWLVIHSGGCDTFTGELGDFFAPDLELNIFGLRPCGDFKIVYVLLSMTTTLVMPSISLGTSHRCILPSHRKSISIPT